MNYHQNSNVKAKLLSMGNLIETRLSIIHLTITSNLPLYNELLIMKIIHAQLDHLSLLTYFTTRIFTIQKVTQTI